MIASEARVPKDKDRISRIELYMSMAHLFASRSTCARGRVGCVAVRDNRVVAAGYNGAPKGFPHCTEVGCGGRVGNPEYVKGDDRWPKWLYPNGCTRAIHAESNMIFYAAKVGIPLDKCVVYSTCSPCLPCAHALVSAGIRGLHYEYPYRLLDGLDFLDEAGVTLEKYGD